MAEKFFLKLLGALGIFLYLVSPSLAEIRTITATGEYRMGDNDTRTVAKQLALQDAKRLALEQVGTYLESVTEIKQFQISRDELRAYTAGIVEVTEQTARDTIEGVTHIVRVDVTAKVDTNIMTRQIDIWRESAIAKTELLRVRAERDQLKDELEAITRELRALKSGSELDTAIKQRQQLITRMEVSNLVQQAWVALWEPNSKVPMPGTSTIASRNTARDLLRRAISLDPSDARAHEDMGAILNEEGNIEAALREYREAVRLEPNNVFILAGLAAVHANAGDLKSAIATLQDAIRLKPNNSFLHGQLGIVLGMQRDYDGAIKESRTAISLDPTDAGQHSSLGFMLSAKGDLDGAIEEHRTAIRLSRNNLPSKAFAHLGLGTALILKEDWDGANASLQSALQLQPGIALPHYYLGYAYAKKGMLAESIRELRVYLKLVLDVPANRVDIENARALLRQMEK